MWQLPDSNIKEILLALEADVTLFPAGMKLHLYTNNLTPTKANVLADFTELTNVEVPGYVATAFVWKGTPFREPSGAWEDEAVSAASFIGTTLPPTPQVVYGWYLTDAAGAVLVASGLFDAPFVYSLPADGFSLLPSLVVSQVDTENYNVDFVMTMS